MFEVKNNNIIMTKGDSGYFVIKLENSDGTEFEPQEGDEIVFSVKKRSEGYLPMVLEKKGTRIIFEAADTEKIPSGEYMYDVCIKTAAEERQTVTEGKYILKKAVHDFE